MVYLSAVVTALAVGAASAGLNVTALKITDGTGTCTLDASQTDGRVCTNDAVRYKVAYQITPPAAGTDQSNTTLTLSLPAGEPFRFSASSPGLASCSNSPVVSPDGKTVTCVVKGVAPNPPAGPIATQAADIFFDVYTNSAAKNGDTLSGLTAKITSTQNPAGATSTAVGVTVIAQPQADLFKKFIDLYVGYPRPAGCTTPGSTATTGINLRFAVGLNLVNVKGHEALAPGWTYTEDFSQLGVSSACVLAVPNYNSVTGQNPWPANPDNLNAGGGTYTFVQGSPTSATITASTTNPPNTSGDVVGAAFGYSNVVALHFVDVWIPNDVADGTAGAPPGTAPRCSLSGKNTITGFDPNGLSGASNLGAAVEPTANNSQVFGPMSLCNGVGEKFFVWNSKGASRPRVQGSPVMSNETSGPNDYVDSYVYWGNFSINPQRVSHCDKWDNRKLQLDLLDPAVNASGYGGPLGPGSNYRYQSVPTTLPMIVDTSAAYAHLYSDSAQLTRGLTNINGEIEFGFLGGGTMTDEQLRAATCNNGDSTLATVSGAAPGVVPASGWITQSQLKANPALVKYINSVRMMDVVVPASNYFKIFTHLKVLGADPFTGTSWPNGTIIPNYWSFQSNAPTYGTSYLPGSTNWRSTTVGHMGNDPLAVANAGTQCTNPQAIGAYCDDAHVDRLRLSTETVTVRKGVAPNDPVKGPLSDTPVIQKNKGEIVTFQLWPSVTAKSAGITINNDLIFTDTLPAGMKFVPGSVKYNGVPVPASDIYVNDLSPATSTIKFRLPNVPAVAVGGPTLPALEYDAEIMVDDQLNNASRTLTNSVFIQACAPGASIGAGGAVTCQDQTPGESVAERTATRTLQLVDSGVIIVQKSAIGGNAKEIGSNFTEGLRYLNAGTSAVAEHRLIDVLPYNGEPNRGSPSVAGDATNFMGSNPVTSVETPTGAYQVFYTTAAPATIDVNPKCPSNTGTGPGLWPAFAPGTPASSGCTGSAGSTVWTLASGGPPIWTGIPANATAIMVVDKVVFPAGDVSRLVKLTFATPNSQDVNRYSNNVSAANGGPGTALSNPADPSSGNGPGATFNVISNNLTVKTFASSISGTVFIDTNRNGATTGFKSGTDTPIAGVTMTLTKAGASIKSALTASVAIPAGQYYNPATGLAEATATATNCLVPAGGLGIGQYLFCNLPSADDYSVVETQPSGYVTTGNKVGNGVTPGTVTGDTITTIGLGAGQKAVAYDFGESQLTNVSGRVYVEKNGNTADDGNAVDTGLGGVTVTLTYTPPGGGAPVTINTTTNPDGTYSFLNLPVGATNLTITETQPAIYGSAYNTPGTTSAQGNNATTLTIATLGVGGSPNNNFAEVLGSVAGKVYNEISAAGIAGQTVTLTGLDASGAPVNLTTTTDASGNYKFTNVPVSGAGGYLVSEPNQPAGTVNGTTTAGTTGGTASNPTTTSSQISGVQVSGNSGAATLNSVNNNFGEVSLTNVSGRVYVEKSGNTTDDGNAVDPGIGGVTMTLTYTPPGGGAMVTATTMTAANGTYSFPNIPEGSTNAVITETQPLAYGSTYNTPGTGGSQGNNTTTLLIGSVPVGGSPLNNFAETAGSVAGKVYNQATNLGISGQTVTLSGKDAAGNDVLLTAVTDANGNYLFTNVPLSGASGYLVSEPNQPAGTVNGTTTQGSTGGTPSNPNTTSSQISGVQVSGNAGAATLNSVSNNFGEIAVTSVSGRVYVEKSGNTTDGGNAVDPGIAGVTMTLTYTPPGGGAPVTVTAVTAADGTYSFPNIPVGSTNATITETQPLQYGSIYNTPGSGAAQGNNTTTLTIASIPAGGSPLNNFAETTGSVAGKVYNQGTNVGILGQTVQLTGTDAAGNPVSLTATTDANGNYKFVDVPLSGPAGYTISEPTQPLGTQNGTTSAGSTGGVGSNPPLGTPTSQIVGVVVSGNAGGTPDTLNSVNNNFGEVVGTTISGAVYVDADTNGTLSAPDVRLGGVTVQMYDATGTTLIATKVTQPDGTYTFTGADGVNQGVAYVVKEVQPTNYANASTNPGASNTTPAANVINIAALPLAGSPNNNFGETGGSVAGRVYNAGTNAPYPGETITLTGVDAAGNPATRTTTTDSTGNYVFANLPLSGAGGYLVSQPAQPAGSMNMAPLAGSTGGTASNPSSTSSQIAAVVVSGSTGATLNSVNNNFPETVGTTISGLVYVDSNRDGALSATDTTRIPGVTVQLLASDGVTVLATKVTDASGLYSFGPADGVTEGGTFFVKEVQSTNYADGGTNPGTAGTSTATNLIKVTNVPLSGSPNNNFGEVAGSVAGKVYNAGTNVGYPNETIMITGVDAAGKTVSRMTTTDANGNYVFTDLPLSNGAGYLVSQLGQPAGSMNMTPLAGSTGGTPTNGSATSSQIAGVQVSGTTSATLNSTANNFPETVGTTISGIVYVDNNRDGTLGATETTRIPGTTVQLLASDGVTVLATKVTDANGAYSFGLADGVTQGGTFFVKETQPANYGDGGTNPGNAATSTATNLIKVTNVPLTGSTNNNFGEVAGSIAGTVTNQTSNTPIPGVVVTLSGVDAAGKPVSLTATTNATGGYTFVDVPLSGPLGYTVTEPTPTGTVNGPTTAGTTGGTATNPDANTSTIAGIKVSGTSPATLDSKANNFAEISIVDLTTTTTGVKNPNGTGTFTVVTSNVGTQPAPNVKTSTQLPIGLTNVVASDGGAYDPATGLVTWPAVPLIATGGKVTFTITLPLASGTSIPATSNTNSFATPTSSTPLTEATLVNNPSSDSLEVAAEPVPTLSEYALFLLALMMVSAVGLSQKKLLHRKR